MEPLDVNQCVTNGCIVFKMRLKYVRGAESKNLDQCRSVCQFETPSDG